MDPAALVTAVAGAIGVVGGLGLSRRGQKDTQRQEVAARRVEKQRADLAEQTHAVQTYELLTERLAGETAREAARADAAIERAVRAEQATERERAAHDATRRHLQEAYDALATLKAVVLSEAAQVAAQDVIDQGLRQQDRRAIEGALEPDTDEPFGP